MLACPFLIESSSQLLITRAGIKAWSSSILGRIRPLILELLALEWRKFHTSELEYLWSQLANLDQILCVASLGWGKGCIRFWGRLTLDLGLRWAIVALWATCYWNDNLVSYLYLLSNFPQHGYTALHYAADRRWECCVQFLLGNGASPDCQTNVS